MVSGVWRVRIVHLGREDTHHNTQVRRHYHTRWEKHAQMEKLSSLGQPCIVNPPRQTKSEYQLPNGHLSYLDIIHVIIQACKTVSHMKFTI